MYMFVINTFDMLHLVSREKKTQTNNGSWTICLLGSKVLSSRTLLHQADRLLSADISDLLDQKATMT